MRTAVSIAVVASALRASSRSVVASVCSVLRQAPEKGFTVDRATYFFGPTTTRAYWAPSETNVVPWAMRGMDSKGSWCSYSTPLDLGNAARSAQIR